MITIADLPNKNVELTVNPGGTAQIIDEMTNEVWVITFENGTGMRSAVSRIVNLQADNRTIGRVTKLEKYIPPVVTKDRFSFL